MDQEREGEIGLGVFLTLLREMVGHMLHIQNAAAFFSWMRAEAPRRFPEVFKGMPERAARALATELGWQVWNVTPMPRNDYRPIRLRRPRPEEPCPCTSGREYGACCAGAPEVPGLSPELLWALVAAELPLSKATVLAEQGGMPRPYLGIVARRLVEAGWQTRAAALLQPLFEEAEVLDRNDLDALDALASTYEKLGRGEEVRSFVERFKEKFLRGSGDSADS